MEVCDGCGSKAGYGRAREKKYGTWDEEGVES